MTPTNPSAWRVATITDIIAETPTVKTFRFQFDSPVQHLPGQHYEIRLTAENGYQAARLYSAASVASGDNRLELTVALMPGGEVSPYLHQQAQPGDQIELRGPLGKFFVWQPAMAEPVLLLGGGSGVVPLRCMLNAHAGAGSAAPMRLLYGSRTYDEIIYKPELLDNPAVQITLSEGAPEDWSGLTGRLTVEVLQTALGGFMQTPVCYLCGSTPFVEAMANLLVSLNVPAERIKAERFGATAPTTGAGSGGSGASGTAATAAAD